MSSLPARWRMGDLAPTLGCVPMSRALSISGTSYAVRARNFWVKELSMSSFRISLAKRVGQEAREAWLDDPHSPHTILAGCSLDARTLVGCSHTRWMLTCTIREGNSIPLKEIFVESCKKLLSFLLIGRYNDRYICIRVIIVLHT